jgi:aspartyl-tRNA(Asn)/glutamyl-tRNA(Gln) amidotransferase subunit C
MPENSEIDVSYVAHLARLNLTDEETLLFQTQLHRVLEHVSKLREIDASEIESAAADATPLFNVFREDDPRDWFTAEEALSNAPHQANGLFIVTKVVE